MTSSLDTYRAIGQQDGARVVLDNTQKPQVQSALAFAFEETIEFLTPIHIVGDTIDVHNKKALLDFSNALRSHFGSAGDEAFRMQLQNKFQNGGHLTPQDVRNTIQLANTRRDVWIADATHTESSRLNLAIDRAIENANYPDPERAEIYKEALRTKLTEIGKDIFRADATAQKTLLTSVATQMAKQLDGLVLNAVGNYADSQNLLPYPGSVAQSAVLAHAKNNGGLAANVPNLQTMIDNKIDRLGNNVTETIGRAMNDINDIRTRFFGGAAATGLTDLKITDSDPHHGGRQVVILQFDRTGHGENKVVYKPRDVRIDQRLTDSTGQQGAGRSLAEIAEGHLGYALPKNTFLARQDGDGAHYGYMGFLSTGTANDNILNNGVEAQRYYKQLGAQLAMLSFMGVTDLHHTNIRNSNGEPHFSDLEIGMKGSAFGKLDEMLRGNATPQQLFGKMDADNIFQKGSQSVTRPHYVVNNGQLTAQHNLVEEAVTDNLVGVRNNVGGIDSNFDNPPVINAYAADLRDGFLDMLRAIQQNGNDYKGFVDSLGNADPPLHMRYHPIATTDNLTGIDVYQQGKMNNPGGIDGIVQNAVGGMTTTKANLTGEPVDRLTNTYINDWSEGDVPYFVRELGTGKLLHNTETELHSNNNNDPYFSDNPLQLAKDCIDQVGPRRLVPVDVTAGGTIGTQLFNWASTLGQMGNKMQEHTDLVG